MVYFRLVEGTKEKAVYRYFPGHAEEEDPEDYGIIILDKTTDRFEISRLAPADYQFTVTVEEQLESRESFNRARLEEGEPPLSEEEFPIPTRPFTVTAYADPVCYRIMTEYKEGKLPKCGLSMTH